MSKHWIASKQNSVSRMAPLEKMRSGEAFSVRYPAKMFKKHKSQHASSPEGVSHGLGLQRVDICECVPTALTTNKILSSRSLTAFGKSMPRPPKRTEQNSSRKALIRCSTYLLHTCTSVCMRSSGRHFHFSKKTGFETTLT